MERWTPESRARQAEAIRGWKPWLQSTGPVTADGKKISSRNAHRKTMHKFYLIACWLAREKKKLLAGKPCASHSEVEAMFADNFVF